MERLFPVSRPYQHQKRWAEIGCPAAVPWALVKAHERQAMKNHDQTLEILAKRGGLDPAELVAVLTDQSFGWSTHTTEARYELEIKRLLELLEEYKATLGQPGR